MIMINKCLSGKRLWGLFKRAKIDYAELLWEDIAFQIRNKEGKKELSYPHFTKAIISDFMLQNLKISIRNKLFWHNASQDTLLTTVNLYGRGESILQFGAAVPPAILSDVFKLSDHYQNFIGLLSGAITQKPRKVRTSHKEKEASEVPPTEPEAPKPTGKRIKHVAIKHDAVPASPRRQSASKKAKAK